MFSEKDRAKRAQRFAAYYRKVFKRDDVEPVCDYLESAERGSDFDEDVLEVVGGWGERSAMESLEVIFHDSSGGDLHEKDFDGLEAIIHETGRPAIVIEDDTFDPAMLTSEWRHLDDADPRSKIEAAIMSVGRIEAPHDLRRPYAGTGFVVGENLIMTNRHVAQLFTQGTGTSALRFFPGASAGLDFKRERYRRGQSAPDVLEVEKIAMVHPYWDMALLKMKQNLTNDRDPLKLTTKTPGELSSGRHIVVIGYPGKDSRGNAKVRDQVFEGRYGIKRLLPGEYDGPTNYRSRDVMAHDTSTLGGSSGAVVLDLESGEVIGLHYAGVYMESNFAVPMSSLAEDARVAGFAPKINFAGTKSPNPEMADLWRQVDRGESTTASGEAAEAKAEEFIIGTPAPDVKQFMPRFDFASLTATDFKWSTALSTALASHLVYERESEIKEACGPNGWKLPVCEFVERANTECFVAGDSNIALVAFRGTEKKLCDWMIDLNAVGTNRPYGRVHRGFWFAFESVARLLEDEISKLGTSKLVLTGHSLGGALALVAAAEWLHAGKYEIQSMYTYGQPAVGKIAFPTFFNEKMNGRYYRFVNDDDIVPRVPPTYKHVGELKQFGSGNDLKVAQNSSNESMVEESGICSVTQFDHLRMALLCEKLTSTNEDDLSVEEGGATGSEEGLLPSVRDHSMARYIGKIAEQ